MKRVLPLLLIALTSVISGFAQSHSDGLGAMQLEKWDKAITIYSSLTQKDPADQVAWLTLGSAYLAKGDKTKAKETFDAAFNAKAEGPLANIASGRILLLLGKPAEAEEVFKKAKKYGKKDIVVKRLLGESYLYTGSREDLVRAETELKEAIDLSAKDFAALMTLAYCYKEIPNGGLSAQNYEYAANLEPNNPLPLFMLAKVYRSAKLNDKFLNYVDKAIALKPDYTDALRAKAEFLYFDSKWEKATETAKDLVNKGTEVTIEDEMLLANLLYITKDCIACSALVEKILKKDPSRNYLRRLQAYCDYDNGKFPEGLRILEDFFKQVVPEKILSSDYEYLAKLQVKSKRDTSVAINNYLKAIQLDSSKWPLHEDIAQLHYSKKDYCSAAISYQAYIDSLTDNQSIVNATYRMGLCHYYCQDDSLHFEKAEKAFSKVTELAPGSSQGWAWRAKSMSKLEPDIANNPEDSTLLAEFGKAKPFFDKFVEIGEADPAKNEKDLVTSYEYLTSYYFLKKDDVNARVYLKKLLDTAPENPTGLEIQKFLDGETPAPPVIKGKGKK